MTAHALREAAPLEVEQTATVHAISPPLIHIPLALDPAALAAALLATATARVRGAHAVIDMKRGTGSS